MTYITTVGNLTVDTPTKADFTASLSTARADTANIVQELNQVVSALSKVLNSPTPISVPTPIPTPTPVPHPVPVATPTPVVLNESAAGTTLTGATGSIITANKTVYTLRSSTSSGLQIYINNVLDPATNNVALLLYFNHIVYQQNSVGFWYGYINGLSIYQSNGDPRVTNSPTPITVPTPTSTGSSELYTYPEGTNGPYNGIGDTGTGAGAQAHLYGRSLGELFGTYTYPNPGGTDNGYTLTQTINKLIGVTGTKPKTMNAFINNAYDSINRVGDGTFAYGWHNDDSTISGPNGFMRPIIGLKLHGWNDTKGNQDTFKDIQNGVYDNLYLTEMNAWISLGYTYLTYRLAYEFNGTFMPDYFGSDTATNQDFAAAMRHIILLMKNRASQAGITAKFTFNPSYINYVNTDTMNGYPGDDVIDIIDCDLYSHCYPKSNPMEIWDANGNWTGNLTSDGVAWQADYNNRSKFWNYPGATQYNQFSSGGWSALQTIAVAKAKGKQIAFSECGCGAKGSDLSVSIPNDPTWVRWFWGICQSAISQGVSIAHINIWNIYADDGQWMYNAPDDYNPQPDVRTAYRKYFGDGYYPGGPTPVNSGTTTGGGTPSPTPMSTPSSPSPTPAPTPVSSSSATAMITDSNGHSTELTLSSYKDYYGSNNDTPLDVNIFYYLDNSTNKPTLGSSADGVITSIVLTENGNNVVVTSGLTNVTTYNQGSNASTATVLITDTSGHTATLTLTAYKDYYGSNNDTLLNANIFYYADSSNNNTPTLNSSANGVIQSAIITNGANIVSYLPNTTYAN